MPSWSQRGVATTSQGHPRTVFKRALQHENLLVAEATAREIGHISLIRGARAHGADRREGAEPAWPLRGALANALLAGAGSNHRRDCARRRQVLSRFPVQDGGRPWQRCGIWLEGRRAERSHRRPWPQKRQRGASPSVGNPSARGLGYPPNKARNPSSRDVAAECLRQADGPPSPGQEIGVPRLE
jgi:hypothetical protein